MGAWEPGIERARKRRNEEATIVAASRHESHDLYMFLGIGNIKYYVNYNLSNHRFCIRTHILVERFNNHFIPDCSVVLFCTSNLAYFLLAKLLLYSFSPRYMPFSQ